MMTKILSFGEVLIDFLALPAQDNGVQHYVKQAGGAPANVAVAVAHLGGNAGFIGMIANDMFGDYLFETLQAFDVDTSYVARTHAAPTALAFVTLDSAGDRHFAFYRPPSADLLFQKENFDLRCFENSSFFHVCSISMTHPAIAEVTRYGMQMAKEKEALISFDINLRLPLWPDQNEINKTIWQALSMTNIAKFAYDELEFLANGESIEKEQLIQKLFSVGVNIVIVTRGAEPMHVLTPHISFEMASYNCDTLDATAAGDAFVGGFLFYLGKLNINASNFNQFLHNKNQLMDAVRFASANGALAVTKYGSFAAMPNLNEVETFMLNHKI